MTSMIKNPRITEKASYSVERDVYTFDVMPGANKTEIGKEIFALYKVKPVKINILAVPRKKIMSRGKEGMKGGGKKALVYLKKGDKIEFV
jgi:large subunit ribosomal protein L23